MIDNKNKKSILLLAAIMIGVGLSIIVFGNYYINQCILAAGTDFEIKKPQVYHTPSLSPRVAGEQTDIMVESTPTTSPALQEKNSKTTTKKAPTPATVKEETDNTTNTNSESNNNLSDGNTVTPEPNPTETNLIPVPIIQ